MCFLWLFIAASLPDGHIFVERSFHKHQSARLRKHKVVEKQECFQFQQYNKCILVCESDEDIYRSRHRRESHECPQKGWRPPAVGRVSDPRWRCSQDVTSFFGKRIFLRFKVSSASVAEVSSQQWQHLESMQTPQQHSRMWLKSSQRSHTEAEITWCTAHCFLPYFHSTVIIQNEKMKRTHASSPGRYECFLLSEWIARCFRTRLQVKVHFVMISASF